MKHARSNLLKKRMPTIHFFIGQHVVDEIVDSRNPACPPEYFNIPIPRGDLLYDPEGRGDISLGFLRSQYDQSVSESSPRQQVSIDEIEMDHIVVAGVRAPPN